MKYAYRCQILSPRLKNVRDMAIFILLRYFGDLPGSHIGIVSQDGSRDRKSVVYGKSVDLGGGRIIKKKNPSLNNERVMSIFILLRYFGDLPRGHIEIVS